jgi:pimeloyl-ACP methyl ester carboxylesterase
MIVGRNRVLTLGRILPFTAKQARHEGKRKAVHFLARRDAPSSAGTGIGMGMSEPDEQWLLLHGTPLTSQVWDGVAEYLQGHGPVWRPDVTPVAGGPDTQAALAVRLASALEHSSQWLHVVGHSFGGQVAIDFALLAPQRVRTLTVICSRDTPFPAFAAAAARLRGGDPVDAGAVLGRWFTAPELAADGPVVSYARHCLRRADRTSWAAALDAIASYDRAGRVGSIAVPCTLIAAELDPVSTPAAMSALASRLPQATVHVLAGAAHMTPFSDPARLGILLARAAGR